MERLLSIEPQDLSFRYELNKQTSSSIRLSNTTDQHVAFKVMTTNPNKYCVLPNVGIVLPGSICDVIVTMTGPTKLPTEVRCADKFLIKSVVASSGATTTDSIKKLFDKDDGSSFQEFRLGVIYTFPSQVSSTVVEKSVSSVTSGSEKTNLNTRKMDDRKLLDIQPSELQFSFKLNKELSCSLQLSNKTKNHVLFKVKTTNPKKYCVQQNVGIVSPGSTCDVTVRMKAQGEIPPEVQCKDKFLIQSTVGSPDATTKNITPEMFNEKGRTVEEAKLGVVYTFPSLTQSTNSESSEANSSIEAEPLQDGPLNIPEVLQWLGGSKTGRILMKGIITGLLGIILWHFLMKILPHIWSLSIVIAMLVVKMIQNFVSNSVENWIVNSLGYIVIHFLAVIFGRRANIALT